ncbi:MAG: carboxypeptidase regulatory-like domain-containing protein [Candidatus Methylomirabilales bacterium]
MNESRSQNSAFFLGLLLLSLATPVRAEDVKGQVEFLGPKREQQWVQVQKDREVCGEYRPLERLLLSPERGVANVLVELEGVEEKDRVRAPGIAVLDNRDCRFMPRVQVAPVGAVLEIRNSDAVLHTAHAFRKRDATLFHLALPHFRDQVRVTLDTPGLLRVVCDVGHVWMRAFIFVTDNAFAAVTDSQGRFALTDIPPGTYRLRVWHELLGTISRPVTVPDGETAVVMLQYR